MERKDLPPEVRRLLDIPQFKFTINQACEMFLGTDVCNSLEASFENDCPDMMVKVPFMNNIELPAKTVKKLYKRYREHISDFMLVTLYSSLLSVEASTIINIANIAKEAGIELPPHIAEMASKLPSIEQLEKENEQAIQQIEKIEKDKKQKRQASKPKPESVDWTSAPKKGRTLKKNQNPNLN
jgi:hypothetical protein